MGIMRKISAIITAVAAVVGVAALTPGRADESGRKFQLIFHSDTRAYYLPCG